MTAEYQRQRRAKIKAMADQSPLEAAIAKAMLDPADDGLVDEILKEDPTLLDIKPRPPLPKDDGKGISRDYRELIQNMSQAQRDAILAKLPMSKRIPQR